MNKNPYLPFPKFVFRTPLYPLQCLSKWDSLADTPVFREALFLASPEFAESKRFAREEKKVEKRDISLYKYFSRACTRCTPFGLFAGCSVGTTGVKQTSLELVPQEQYRRCTRLDMQYLCALIQKIERDPFIRPQLLFFPNDSLYDLGGKLRYIEYHYHKTQRIHRISAVEISDYLEAVLESARDGAQPQELARTIIEEDVSMEEALEFVNEMIDVQLLKSELEPSVVGRDVLDVLIDKLETLEATSYLSTLCSIRECLEQIDRSPIGMTEEFYEQIIEQIKSFGVEYDLKFLFQTDLFKPVQIAAISDEVCDDLRQVLLFFTALSQPVRHAHLDAFREAFFKRYEEQTVPLAEVLDTELGLGYPLSVTGSNDVSPLVDDLMLPMLRIQENDHIPFSRKDGVLLRKYVECIKNGKDTIVLTDADFNIDFNKDPLPKEFLVDTVSVMCSLLADDGARERKIYVKGVNTIGGAVLLGRFCHLDAEMERLIYSIAQKEDEFHSEVIIAEISHLPESRIGNIASRPLFRDFVIHYLSNSDAEVGQQIPLTDLLLSVKGNKFVLTSSKYKKEVYPKLTCAHNHSLSPIPFYRFLCDLQVQQTPRFLQFSYGNVFNNFNYLPRLQYKNAILARQKWIIKKDEINAADKLSDVELRSLFTGLMQIHRLTRYVVVADGDNEMFIDLQNAHSLRVLLNIVKKRDEFALEEFLFDPNRTVVQDSQGGFTNEMIIVFHK
jgi:hypothetical protein